MNVMSELIVLRGDVTTLSVGAIVNAAKPSLMGGGGVDGAIHAVGGPSILKACKAIVSTQGPCQPGQAVVTGAGELPCGIVIHTVGPIWDEAQAVAHDETLADCYRNCLDLAANYNVKEVAFPNISTGVYGFPKPRAASVAINATIDWLEQNQHLEHELEQIIFVCFDDDNVQLYQSLLG